ncbi:MAG: hypothetical protein MUD10_04570 [Candidatus Pacebacteria bacterium]|jgi:hypothetical protein|nr:hypothetical protein [Candidatus Paceibacterota bacterium]
MTAKIIKLIVPREPPLPVPKPKRAFWRRAKRYIPGLAMLVFLLGLAATVRTTASVFSDDESSPPAIVNLGTLDFIAATTSEGFVPLQVAPSQKARGQAGLINKGNLPFQYSVGIEKTGGGENVCEFMQLEAYLGGILVYQGGLINFATSSIEFATTTADWSFDVSYPADALGNIGIGRDCQFKIKFIGWQLAADHPGAGFFDEEEIEGNIEVIADAPSVKVVYPNGGEHWYIVADECVNYDWCRNWCVLRGMNNKCEYEILWDAKRGGPRPNHALWIDAWYSTDSGQTWLAKIADKIPNTGKFLWKIPYDLRFVSDKARIKVVARDKQDASIWNWDESDADFCPPLLSIEDLVNRTSGQAAEELFTAPAASSTTAAGGLAIIEAQESATSTDETQAVIPMTMEDINREINQINNSDPSAENMGSIVESAPMEILLPDAAIPSFELETANDNGSPAPAEGQTVEITGNAAE